MIHRSDAGLIALGALLLTLAYPPFGVVGAPFICLIPAGILILRGRGRPNSWRWRLHVGFGYGLVTNGVLLYWLAASLWAYGRGAVVLYPVAVLLFGGVTAVMFAIVGRVIDGAEGRLVLALPAGVVALEWLAGQVGVIALPWNQLALTVTSTPLLLQSADLAGAEGLAFLLATINALLALAWWQRDRPRRAFGRLEAAVTVAGVMMLYGAHRMNTIRLDELGEVAVVQPGVAVDEKWGVNRRQAVVEAAFRLTEELLETDRPAMVVWPETAIPGDISEVPVWSAELSRIARRSGATLVVGSLDRAESPVGPEADGPTLRSNAALAFEPRMAATDEARVLHRKQKLVPFVERVPDVGLNLSRAGLGGFEAGASLEPAEGPLGRFGTIICFEMTFAGLPRELRRAGAEVLLVLSNDAWLGAGATEQHFAHAALRAVENRVSVVRSANRGVSGIVDPLGRVVTRSDGDPSKATALVGQVDRAAAFPLAVRFGGAGGPVSLGLLFLLLVGSRRSGRRWEAESREDRNG